MSENSFDWQSFRDAAGLPGAQVSVRGREAWPSCFDVSGLALGSMAAAAGAIGRYAGGAPAVLDARLAALWFDMTLAPQGWDMPSLWDPIAGNYETADGGWVRLHTNAPHHREAALRALALPDDADREAVARACAARTADDIETAVVEADGCAAALRSLDGWADHPQGRAVAGEPLIAWDEHEPVEPQSASQAVSQATSQTAPVDPSRPLAGIRVLDVTRVLAGPVAGRCLAAYGANVLRIDPPGWDEPGVIPEVALGKRCATLDLKTADGRARFETLLGEADLLLHGLRPGAMAGLGFDAGELRRVNPRLVDVSLCAWGWTGPWAARRGFDSLVQMACGIADHGRATKGRAVKDGAAPVPLPVQALDHATGYTMAAAAVRALELRRDGRVTSARLSLARTAHELTRTKRNAFGTALAPLAEADLGEVGRTGWGPARRVRWPMEVEGAPASWPNEAPRLHSSTPAFAN